MFVTTDHYSKLARAVPTVKVIDPVVGTVFFKNWIIPNGIRNSVLTDNGIQFLSMLFAEICASLGTGLAITMQYHQQSKGQMERYNKPWKVRLRH